MNRILAVVFIFALTASAGAHDSCEEIKTAALAAGGLLPDIQDEVPRHLQIQNEQQKEMLRFSSSHINLGTGPLQVRGTSVDGVTKANQEILDANKTVVATHPSGEFAFHAEHNHWHQSAVADFSVRKDSPDGEVVASSFKVTFCLIDFDKTDLVKRNSERVYWECNGDLQGISSGWIDEYHHSTKGQELDITGVPEGEYYLVNTADPDNHWCESDDTNNTAWVKFRLSRKGANPEITELEHSPCSGATCGNTSNK